MVEDEVAQGEDLANFVENNSTSITFVMIQKFFILQIGGLHLWDCCVKLRGLFALLCTLLMEICRLMVWPRWCCEILIKR